MMRRLGVLLLLIVFVGTISMPALAAPIVVKYATGTPSHDPIEDAAYGSGLLFKSLVETRTGGRYRVEYLGGAVVGGEREQAEGVKLGTFQMASISDGPLPGFCREMLVLGILTCSAPKLSLGTSSMGPSKRAFELFLLKRQESGSLTEVIFAISPIRSEFHEGPRMLRTKFR